MGREGRVLVEGYGVWEGRGLIIKILKIQFNKIIFFSQII